MVPVPWQTGHSRRESANDIPLSHWHRSSTTHPSTGSSLDIHGDTCLSRFSQISHFPAFSRISTISGRDSIASFIFHVVWPLLIPSAMVSVISLSRLISRSLEFRSNLSLSTCAAPCPNNLHPPSSASIQRTQDTQHQGHMGLGIDALSHGSSFLPSRVLSAILANWHAVQSQVLMEP